MFPFVYLWTTVLPLEALTWTLLQCILLLKIMGKKMHSSPTLWESRSSWDSLCFSCLTDAKYTGSMSNFCPECAMTNSSFSWRPSDSNKKAVVLYVFCLCGVLYFWSLLHIISGLSLQIYITCLLKASAAMVQVDENHKACSFRANGWVWVDDATVLYKCIL